MYSGKPNPTWILPSSLEEDLMNRISTLTIGSEKLLSPSNLGYRGFILKKFDSDSNIIRTVKLYKGFIEVSNPTDIKYYEDPQKQIEIWLLSTSSTAQPKIDTNVLNQIVDELYND
jgi:hypothetical protein